MSNQSIGVIIPLYQPEPWLCHIRRFIQANTGIPIVLVMSVKDKGENIICFPETAIGNVSVIYIPHRDFNHGSTRELFRKKLNVDIVVFLTQDAISVAEGLVGKLVAPLLENNSIAVSYGRQICHDNANILEAFPRQFNYGTEPQIRGILDIKDYGVYTFFCSNSCAAWRNKALDEIGGFKKVLTNEDYFAVAELLQVGYKIAYVPDAVVKHSHHYTLWQEFQRYFDTGYVRAENPLIQQLVGNAESRGLGFLRELICQLWRNQPLLIPYAILQTAVRWFGYRIGFFGKYLPWRVKRLLSQQTNYWAGER